MSDFAYVLVVIIVLIPISAGIAGLVEWLIPIHPKERQAKPEIVASRGEIVERIARKLADGDPLWDFELGPYPAREGIAMANAAIARAFALSGHNEVV